MSGKDVALVLASGGARGLAQIGAIEVLEERGYNIVAVSGASMGAVVGGVYAAGKLPAYKAWVEQLGRMDVFRLFDLTFTGQGFLKGERVFDELERVLGDCQIEDCPIPFTAVTTDLKHMREIWLQQGSMFRAIRASVAVPSIVRPVKAGDKVLVDGGVSNPMPIEPVKQMPHDLLVVVNVNGNFPYTTTFQPTPEEQQLENEYLRRLVEYRNKWFGLKPPERDTQKTEDVERLGAFGMLNRAIDYMENKLIDHALKAHRPDVVIETSRYAANMFDFHKGAELAHAGRAATAFALDKWEQSKAVKEQVGER